MKNFRVVQRITYEYVWVVSSHSKNKAITEANLLTAIRWPPSDDDNSIHCHEVGRTIESVEEIVSHE